MVTHSSTLAYPGILLLVYFFPSFAAENIHDQ